MKIQSRLYSVIFFLFFLVSTSGYAHAPRENYVWVNVDEDHISGRFELNARDISNKLGISIDVDSDEFESEVDSTSEVVQRYLANHFSISDTSGEISYTFTGSGVSDEADEFAQYFYKTDRLPQSDDVTINNTIFLTTDLVKEDRLHRSLIVLEYNKVADKDFGVDTPFLVFGPSKSSATLDLVNPSRILQWKEFLKQGVLHIWFGLDHVLFVLVLLLATVLTVKNKEWIPISGFKSAFINTLKIITLFTIAHSITLSLAAFGLVSLNSAFVETVIAVSIIAIALNNIYPVINSHAWILVFVFGLFHGLGFASVMADLQFRTGMLGHILVMFNVGVEIGQFAIVALVFPLFYFLRTRPLYRPGVVIPISLAAIVLATYWVAERTGLMSHVV